MAPAPPVITATRDTSSAMSGTVTPGERGYARHCQ
jgi:hypothetical protein